MLGFLRNRHAASPLAIASSAEFAGAALFQLIGGSTNDALAIAGSFAALQYATRYLSGGHLNPATSLAAAGSGHIKWSVGSTYALMQLLGALVGALLQALLLPGAHIGDRSPGCMHPGADTNGVELFGWEMLMCLAFVLVQYSATLVRPGHGDAAPLASGTALYAVLVAAGPVTGGSPVNAARTLASALVFNCYWNAAWVYLAAQFVAVILAACFAVLWHGAGPYYSENSSEIGHGLLPEDVPEGGGAHGRTSTFAPTGRV